MVLKNLSYSGTRRMFIGLFFILFCTINFSSFFLYAIFSSTLETEIKAKNMQFLKKTMNATELLYNNVIALSTQLGYGNTLLTQIMFQTGRNRILEYRAHQVMQNTMISYPYIDYIAIYNERIDTFLSTKYFTVDTELNLKYLINHYYQKEIVNLTIPFQVNHKGSIHNVSASNTVTLIIYSPLSLNNDKGALILGINCNFFQQLIKKLDSNDLETIMILHNNGQVISHPETHELLKYYSEKEYLGDIYLTGESSSSFTSIVDGIETNITYMTSSILGWTFINMMPAKMMVSKLYLFRNLTFALTFCILCGGIFISYLMALNMNKPIQRILKQLDFNSGPRQLFQKINENDYIEKQIDYLRLTVNTSESFIRSTIVFDLLKNQYIDNQLLGSHLVDTIYKSPYYLACIISFDEREQFNLLTENTQEIERNKLMKISIELVKKVCVTVDDTILSATDIGLILHFDTAIITENLIPVFMQINDAIKKCCNFTVTSAIGSIVNSIFAINDSFDEAEQYLEERFFQGSGNVIFKQNVQQRKDAIYPHYLKDQIYNAILANSKTSIHAAIKKFFEIIETASYEYARIYLTTISIEILPLCLTNKISINADMFYTVISQLQKAETLALAKTIMTDFYLSISDQIGKNHTDILPPLIQDSIDLISERFQDPLFSINSAAEHFNITPAYFNRIFKKYKHTSYSEFLSGYRMEVACRLLKETSKSIITISLEVGISNTTYFYTQFKKIYNITPQQYRRNESLSSFRKI